MAKARGGNSDPHDHNGIPIHDHIHNRLEFYFNSLSLPWKSPMQFPMHIGLLCAHDNETKQIDICSFISGNIPNLSFSPFAYFDRSVFPFVDQQRVSPQLHRALVESAVQAGFQIFSNGTSYTKGTLQSRKKFPLNSTPPKGSVTYVCNRYDLYSKPFTEDREKDDDKMTSKTFRGVSLHNNERGNSRGLEGKKGARKSNSAKVASTENACSGCTIHCKHMHHHPRDIPTLIPSGRNYVHSVHGITASLPQVRYAFK
eukprot:scaffold1029_cov194-Amphora_coffeaeformis.AAC.1